MQTDTNRGLGTWKSLGLAGIQGESRPVVQCMGLIQLRGESGMTGINFLWLRQLPRLLQRIKQLNVIGSVVFRVTSLVTAHTKKMVITASRYISWKKILKLHHVVLTYVTLMVLQHKRLILNQSKWFLVWTIIRCTQGAHNKLSDNNLFKLLLIYLYGKVAIGNCTVSINEAKELRPTEKRKFWTCWKYINEQITNK